MPAAPRPQPSPLKVLAALVPLCGLVVLLKWLRVHEPVAAQWLAGGVVALPLAAVLALALEGYWYPPARASRLARLAAARRPPPPPPARRTDAPPVPWVGEQPWRFYVEDERTADASAAWRDAEELARLPLAVGCALTADPASRVAGEAEAEEKLGHTPQVLAEWNPVVWPVCCDHLATLILADPEREDLATWERLCGPLDRAVEEPELGWAEELRSIRAGRPPENGVNVFCCPVCHRVSGYHSHT